MTSAPFRVSKPFASFLVGGGSHETTCVELVRSDTQQVVFRVSGKDREDLERVVADLSAHQGKEIVIRLVDLESGSWGHINFDEFRLHETKPAVTPAPPLPPVITAKRATAAATGPAKTVTPPGTAATTTTPTRPNFVRSYPMRQWVLIGSQRRSGIIPEEAAGVMDDLTKKGSVVKWFSFTPSGGWTILHGHHEIFCRNVGDDAYKQLSDLQGKRVELKSITFSPRGDWVILYGRHFFSQSPNVPADVLKALNDARVLGEELKSVAFSPGGGCVVLSGRNKVFVSGRIPDAALSQLKTYRNSGHDLKSMAFAPGGGWTILLNYNGAWIGPNVGDDVIGRREGFQPWGIQMLELRRARAREHPAARGAAVERFEAESMPVMAEDRCDSSTQRHGGLGGLDVGRGSTDPLPSPARRFRDAGVFEPPWGPIPTSGVCDRCSGFRRHSGRPRRQADGP